MQIYILSLRMHPRPWARQAQAGPQERPTGLRRWRRQAVEVRQHPSAVKKSVPTCTVPASDELAPLPPPLGPMPLPLPRRGGRPQGQACRLRNDRHQPPTKFVAAHLPRGQAPPTALGRVAAAHPGRRRGSSTARSVAPRRRGQAPPTARVALLQLVARGRCCSSSRAGVAVATARRRTVARRLRQRQLGGPGQLDGVGVVAARRCRQLDGVWCCSSPPCGRGPLDRFASANCHGLLEASPLEGDAKHCLCKANGDLPMRNATPCWSQSYHCYHC
jgi:hypothetical protein